MHTEMPPYGAKPVIQDGGVESKGASGKEASGKEASGKEASGKEASGMMRKVSRRSSKGFRLRWHLSITFTPSVNVLGLDRLVMNVSREIWLSSGTSRNFFGVPQCSAKIQALPHPYWNPASSASSARLWKLA